MCVCVRERVCVCVCLCEVRFLSVCSSAGAYDCAVALEK